MTYISVNFIYFLIVFLVIYSVVKNQSVKRVLLLAGNVFFYYWAGISSMVIMFTSAIFTYVAGRLMDRVYESYRVEGNGLKPPERLKLFNEYKKKTIWILVSTLALILFVLIYVKIGKFAGWQTGGFAEFSFGKSIIVPLGISYYTFSMTGYLFDVYRDKIRPERNLMFFLTGVTYFPHIIQGPISKYERLMEQLKALPVFEYERMCSGLQLMLWGYMKKLVLADTISLYTTQVFSNVSGYSMKSIIVATFLYAIQLYADFSGCIDIVTGISEIIGIRLDKNFNQPFFSTSAAEFWRRWHISLGVWFKDYIYMPIATASGFKSLVKKIRKKYGRQAGVIVSVAIPSLAVWLLTGIWHGTGWDYILWGLYWGTIIIISEILNDKYEEFRKFLHIKETSVCLYIFRVGRTFLLYCLGLVIIMKSSVPYVAGNIHRTFTDNLIIVIGTLGFLLIETIQEMLHKKELTLRGCIGEQKLAIRWTIYLAALLLLLVLGKYGTGYNADTFIYAGF